MSIEGLLFGLLQVLWCHNFDVSSSSHASSNFGSASCRCHVLIGVLQVLWCHNFSVSSSSYGSTNFGSASCRCHVLIGVLQVLWCHNVGVSSSSHGSSSVGLASCRCHDVVTSASHFDGSKPSHGLAVAATAAVAAGSCTNGMCCTTSLNKFIYPPLLAPVIKVRLPTHKCSYPCRF